MNNHYRQGDILIVQTTTMPTTDLKKVKSILVAEGSKTEHKHVLKSSSQMLLHEKEGARFVRIQKKAELVHDEHARIEIPAGDYEIRIQREFDLVQGTRDVTD